jgi:DNA-binding transcriptional LysR family regulator
MAPFIVSATAKVQIMLNTALKYFLEIVSSGSLTMAAHKLHVAPSAVSRMVRKLEDEHGMALFERHSRGMVLTEAGRLLASYARRASLESERVRADIRGLHGIEQTLIKVSANQAFANELLPSVMGDFRQKEPAVTFKLSVLQAAEINRRVREGEDDIGLCYSMAPPEEVEVQYARRVPVYAIMPPHHPLAKRPMISMKEIADYPVALMGEGSTIRFIVELCCLHEDLKLDVVMTCNRINTIHNFCREWNIISFCGYLTVQHALARGELVAVRVSNPELHQREFNIQTMAGRELPPSAQRLIQAIIQRVEAAELPFDAALN